MGANRIQTDWSTTEKRKRSKTERTEWEKDKNPTNHIIIQKQNLTEAIHAQNENLKKQKKNGPLKERKKITFMMKFVKNYNNKNIHAVNKW